MITKLTQELNSFLFFRSRFFNFLINNNFDNKIIFNPESLWKGNKKNGNKILEGFLNYQKETIYIPSPFERPGGLRSQFFRANR